jgi:hypothetical protein
MAARKKTAPPAAVPLAESPTLERLYTSLACFGVTQATVVQRAICRVMAGLPLGELALAPEVVSALGGEEAAAKLAAGGPRPAQVYLISGIRGGKSLLAAALAVELTQIVDLSQLGAGEVARVSILSISVDSAKAIYDHLVGNILAQSALRSYLVGEPTADGVVLRQERTGRLVEIRVVAGARAGGTLVSRWSAGAIFDEAPRMSGGDAVINFADSRDAVLGRLLPGATLFALGSPWGAQGDVYEIVQERFGKPGPDCVVIRAPAHHLNPTWWTEARREALKKKPDVYRTDVLAEFLDPDLALFTSDAIQACSRREALVIAPEPGVEYAAAMDPATRGNAWTLVVGCRRGGKVVVCLARQWVGSSADPLSPAAVLAEMAILLRTYSLDTVVTDQWAADAIRDLALPLGLYLQIRPWTVERKVDLYEAVRIRLSMGTIELPPDPLVAQDLASVRRKLTASAVHIKLGSSSDSRHADYAPAIALLCEVHTEEALAVKQSLDDDIGRRFLDRLKASGREDEWNRRSGGAVSWLRRG